MLQKKIKVLFEVVQIYYWVAMKPLFDEMSKDKDFELYVKIGKNQKRHWGIFLISQKKKIEKEFQSKGIRLTEQTNGFDIVICSDTLGNPQKYGTALLCNIEHGVSIKTQRYRNLSKQSQVTYHRFIEGPYRKQKYLQYRLEDKLKIFETGLPKLDVFFNGSLIKKQIIQNIGLDENKKTILYAPSYKPSSIFDLTEELTKLNDFNIIIKLHPYSWAGKYASHSQHRFVEKRIKGSSHIYLLSPDIVNIMPYLFIADTLISEGSSVLNEFLALRRVGIIYEMTDPLHSDGQSVLDENIEQWLPSFIHINDAKNLKKAVYEAVDPDKNKLSFIDDDIKKMYFPLDGKASQRVVEVLKKEIS